MIITRTPYRLSLFGGGTDYKTWFEYNNCLVINVAIDYHCYISLRKLPPYFDHKTRVVYSKIESVNSVESIEHPVVRECLNYLRVHDGLEIHHDGDMPARSGIGSSSSFTVGLLNALYALKGNIISASQLAADAIKLEREILDESGGIQDQIAAAYGGINLIKAEGASFSVSPLCLPSDFVRDFESYVLMGYSGTDRLSSEYAAIHQEQLENGTSRSTLSEIHDIANQGLLVLSTTRDLHEIGYLIDQSWKIKKSNADKISNPQIDNIYNIAMKNGALGGKLMGAGGGGFFYFLAPPDAHEAIKKSLPQVKVWVPFRVSKEGSQVIYYEY